MVLDGKQCMGRLLQREKLGLVDQNVFVPNMEGRSFYTEILLD